MIKHKHTQNTKKRKNPITVEVKTNQRINNEQQSFLKEEVKVIKERLIKLRKYRPSKNNIKDELNTYSELIESVKSNTEKLIKLLRKLYFNIDPNSSCRQKLEKRVGLQSDKLMIAKDKLKVFTTNFKKICVLYHQKDVLCPFCEV